MRINRFLTSKVRAISRTLFDMGDEDAVLCAFEWVSFMEDIDVFSNVYPPQKQGFYRILLADCNMSFRAMDWDLMIAEWRDEDVR